MLTSLGKFFFWTLAERFIPTLWFRVQIDFKLGEDVSSIGFPQNGDDQVRSKGEKGRKVESHLQTILPSTAGQPEKTTCATNVAFRPPHKLTNNTLPIPCSSIESIPPGKAGAKVLKCGIPGCTSNNLFDRKYELQRHMDTHVQGRFPCHISGCERGATHPFKRAEHLRNHMRKIHQL